MTVADANDAQRIASNGAFSVWVAASAGTGKTKVLTDRVLDLMLKGNAPGKILCLTFTKAAAAEMSNRLAEELAKWSVMPGEELSRAIKALTGEQPDADLVARARRLFARMLDTPGGMRIMTLHSFCQSVLRRFPLEAGLPPHFEVMDERSTAELLAAAQAAILDQARSEPESVLGSAVIRLTEATHESGFQDLMRALTAERGRLNRFLDEAGGLDAYLVKLRDRFQIGRSKTAAIIAHDLIASYEMDAENLRNAAEILLLSKAKTDTDRGSRMLHWLALPPESRQINSWFDLFLTLNRTPRTMLATKAILARDPWIGTTLLAEQERLVLGFERLRAAEIFEATSDLTRVAASLLRLYRDQKTRRGLLDYDDLVLETRDLLNRPGVAPWVLFKLDGGIDHILIDEAQDTNPDQWQVVSALADEFFAGEGAGAALRTIFAVGDAKQSIFSFQRADPEEFLRMRAHFARKVTEAKMLWRDVPLNVSFRSTEAVLKAVDAVFAATEARAGVALDGGAIRHQAHRAGHAGMVELWPPLMPDDDAEFEPWAAPVEQQRRLPPRTRLAQLIAATVAEWLERGEPMEARGRPMRAGDILVLVRRRGGFVTELLRELKRRGVPVAGADRMVLANEIAVADLMALGRFLLMPDDDLSLAEVLKSPLIGLDEEQLFIVAHGRPHGLWPALRARAELWAQDAANTLSDLLAKADFKPPYELYAEFLSDGARRRLTARLGPEAGEAIEEFLAQALAFEASHVPTLETFLHWLERGESEVKRDLDATGRDELRVMTVHGSKGLQAPVVFLPDCWTVPTQLPLLRWLDEDGLMLWPKGGADEPLSRVAEEDARAKRDEEYRRLLYVALTRAADRVVVCAWGSKRTAGGKSWYEMIQDGLVSLGLPPVPISVPAGQVPFPGDGIVLTNPQIGPHKPDRETSAPAGPAPAAPEFLAMPPATEPAPPRPLIASRPAGDEPPVLSPLNSTGQEQRFQRGILIHRMLQTLPDLPDGERAAAARRFLAQPGHGLSPERQSRLADETLAVLAHPEFAALWAPGSRAEVPIVGLVGDRAFSARVDRLMVTDSDVLVVDYKTNRPPPLSPDLVADAYREQLRAYRLALEAIYPAKRVRTLLLWTDGPSIMEVAT